MIHTTLKLKDMPVSADPKGHYMHLEILFHNTGRETGNCKLVRPIHPNHDVNMAPEANSFMLFIEAMTTKKDVRVGWNRCSDVNGSHFRLEYDNNSKLSINAITLGVYDDKSTDSKCGRCCSSGQMREVWYELIRVGFRPSIGDFKYD
jgi:hypothetical protein